jgi:secondary thiamine-phosphate synthase enzyme
MEILTEIIQFNTRGHTDIVNLTEEIEALLLKTELVEGSLTVFSIGSTTGITTIEYEPGLVHTDVSAMLDQIAPYGKPYQHNRTWGDDNGAAHLRSSLFGTSYSVPFVNSKLVLGTWQQIVFIDFDTRARRRKVVVQFMGK